MQTTAASGSGEPPESGDYDEARTLPRSGLLERAHGEERPIASLRATPVRPLMRGVGPWVYGAVLFSAFSRREGSSTVRRLQ